MSISVRQLDQLVASIRAVWVQREARADRPRISHPLTSSSSEQPDPSAAGALDRLQQRLSEIERSDPKAVELALTAFVEAVLIQEFENRRLALDASFSDVVRRVVAELIIALRGGSDSRQ